MKVIGFGLALIVVVGLLVLGSCRDDGDANAATGCSYRAGRALPDVRCTPGIINPAVTQATIAATICTVGWTALVRPPSSYTRKLKLAGLHAYHAVSGSYQEDHLIPLELGGSPRSPRNLWPQPLGYALAKDRVENLLHKLVCSGVLSLWVARGLIATDWRAIKFP